MFLLSDRWPATTLALKRQRGRFKLWIVLLAAGLLFQAILALFDQYKYAKVLPLYIVAWILPGITAAYAAGERLSGKWEQVKATQLKNLDLYASLLLGPSILWIGLAGILCWPFWHPRQDDGFPPMPPIDLNIGQFPIYIENTIGWAVVIGVIASGAAYAALGLFFGMRARTVRSAITQTYVANAAFSYFGMMLSFTTPIVGNWAEMPALTYAIFTQPLLILAPGWMVGGSLYSIHSEWLHTWIVWMTVLLFCLLATAIGWVSFLAVRRSRASER